MVATVRWRRLPPLLDVFGEFHSAAATRWPHAAPIDGNITDPSDPVFRSAKFRSSIRLPARLPRWLYLHAVSAAWWR
jgi:hypothetical protein